MLPFKYLYVFQQTMQKTKYVRKPNLYIVYIDVNLDMSEERKEKKIGNKVLQKIYGFKKENVKKNAVVRKFTICIHRKTQDDYSKEDGCLGHAVEPLIHMPLFSYKIRKVDMNFVEGNKRTQTFCKKIISKITMREAEVNIMLVGKQV
jgi:hypothetical protein